MRPITIIICFGLFLNCISHTVYAQDSVIKQKLSELEFLIDKEPPFSFRDGMQGKLLFKERVKQAILLAEDSKLEEAKNIIHRLLVEIESLLTIINPLFRENIRQRLLDILSTQEDTPAQE